jgi:ribosomal protein L11 methyltransferase
VVHTPKSLNRGPLWKVSVGIAPEAEDAIVEMLAETFGVPASVYTDTEKQTTSVSVFLPTFSVEHRAVLRKGLAAVRAAGLNVAPARISAKRIARENWAESWKRHFKPLEISSKLLVLPSWSKRRPKTGQSLVILDPGLSFGTGHHPTTAFCLEQIATLRDASTEQSLLDIGTGSGILAISAAKLGYSPVMAFDFDPDAVRVATANAAVNRVELAIFRKDLTKLAAHVRPRFHVVCANLIYDLVVQERERILGRVSEAGRLVLAGILTGQFPAVRRAYEEMGMQLVTQQRAGEWQSGAFRFRY